MLTVSTIVELAVDALVADTTGVDLAAKALVIAPTVVAVFTVSRVVDVVTA